MVRILKTNDIKPVLKLATNDTKELVVAGINFDDDFPELLSNYNMRGTRDYNMALIIVAFYTYCMKSNDSELKRFALSTLQQGTNSNKLFEYLKVGNGKRIKDCMGLNFVTVLDKLLQQVFSGDESKDKRLKIIENFKNRAGKITSWRINGSEIADLINKFLNREQEEVKNGEDKAKKKNEEVNGKIEEEAKKKAEEETRKRDEEAKKKAEEKSRGRSEEKS